jgi:nitronate monooxygenase
MGAIFASDFLERFGLDQPVVQAGMGGGVAGGELAGAVSASGGLGTVGMMAPRAFAAALIDAKRRASGRTVCANLLVPFTRAAHIDACLQAEIPLVVFHGGQSPRWTGRLRERRVAVFVTVGTRGEAQRALAGGADGLVLQGREAGGHLLGVAPVTRVLADVLDAADGTAVLAAGGIADARDVRAALAAGATAAVAGTRFLLTQESAAHPAYKRRVLAASETLTTLLFGVGWPLLHRVIANEATERWCQSSDLGPRWVRRLNRGSAPLARAMPLGALGAVIALQRPGIPIFSPAAPLRGMPERTVRSAALYAGETVGRIHEIVPAAEAVELLARG